MEHTTEHTVMANNGTNLEKTVRYAVAHPRQSSRMLARAVHSEACCCKGITSDFVVRLANAVAAWNGTSPTREELNRAAPATELRSKPFRDAVRDVLQNSQAGITALGALVYEELRYNQNCSREEILDFVGTLLDCVIIKLRTAA